MGTNIQRSSVSSPAVGDIAFPASRLGDGVAMRSQRRGNTMHKSGSMSSATSPTLRDSSELGRGCGPQPRIGVRKTSDDIVIFTWTLSEGNDIDTDAPFSIASRFLLSSIPLSHSLLTSISSTNPNRASNSSGKPSRWTRSEKRSTKNQRTPATR